jgi:hypothetical protein
LPQVLALWPCRACCIPLSTGRGFWGHSCHKALAQWPRKACCSPLVQVGAFGGILAAVLGPYGPARLVTALYGLKRLVAVLFVQAGAFGRILAARPWPNGPARLGTALFAQASALGGHSCNRPWPYGPARFVTALFLHAGGFGGTLATGLGPRASQGLLQPLRVGRGFRGILATRPLPFGPARLVTALYGLTRLVANLALLPQGLALWPRNACYSPLRADWGFWGILATRLCPLAPQGLLQPSAPRHGL